LSSNVTLKHIADELGLSAMTVSRAINNKENVDIKTRSRVLKKARMMGYSPNRIAKSLVNRKTQTIGVVLPEISHSFFPNVVKGIEEAAYNKKYQLFLTNSVEDHEREKQAIETLRSHRVDGLLISCAQTAEDSSYYKELVDTGLPVVFFDREADNAGASSVVIDDVESSYKVTTHLIQSGYRKIGHLHGPEKVSIGKKRMIGYKMALEDHGLDFTESRVAESGFLKAGGYRAMKELLSLPAEYLPDAVVSVNDPVAYGAMEAIQEAGLKIPEDIAITGFTDDVMAPLVDPPLTTIFQDGYQIGLHAAQKLINVIENEDTTVEKIYIKTSLVIRSSCGSLITRE
jgi:DNA-binding LacI/PurR family transcriptional regulator